MGLVFGCFLVFTTDAVSHIAALVPPAQSSARPRNDGTNNGPGHLRHVAECHVEAYPSCPLKGRSRLVCERGRKGERQPRILTREIASPWHDPNHRTSCGQLLTAQPRLAAAPQRTQQKARAERSGRVEAPDANPKAQLVCSFERVRTRTRARRSSSSRRRATDRFESRDR